MKRVLAKGLLAVGVLLAISGCETNKLSYANMRMIEQPFSLRSNDPLLDQRLCSSSASYKADCDGIPRTTAYAFRENMRANVYDNLSDRLFSSNVGGKKARWRLKKDRVEWQYRF